MILICYDGSEDAKAAIHHAGGLFTGQQATVLTVWQPVALIGTRAPTAFMFLPSFLEAEKIDEANETYALKQAQEGVALARDAGIAAEALTCPQKSTIAEAILSEAVKLDATAILIGSRGRTGMKSLLLGSVSHAVIQHADRPVIAVPSARVAKSRAELRGLLNKNHA